jgi:hypothetical protein
MRVVVSAAVAATCFLTACGGDLVGNLSLPPAASPDAYWALDMNYKAINLSLDPSSNTVQLGVTPRTVTGEAITGVTTTPTYISVDSAALQVTADGLLTAKKVVSDRAFVIARLTIGDVTHIDTAFVRVFASPPSSPAVSFSVQPPPGDSAKWSASLFYKDITPVITAQNGTRISGLLIHYHSSNPLVASYDATNNGLGALQPGTAMITASTYAFTTGWSDSVLYTIGFPTIQLVGVGERQGTDGTEPITYFGPDTVVIGIGGSVMWQNLGKQNTKTVGIVFDDPSAAGALPFPLNFLYGADSGNIAPIVPNKAFVGGGRQFRTAGTYTYHDDHNQATGYIIVRSESQ